MIKEIYISVDIEADGPYPGDYSMMSLGAVVTGCQTSEGEIVAFDVTDEENRFYTEIKPISDEWILSAMTVGVFSGFSAEDKLEDLTGDKLRAYMVENGEDPEVAMTRFAAWVEEVKVKHDARAAVFAAFPLGFDWMFTYWYLCKYSELGSPFGHSSHIDIKTLYMEKGQTLISRSTKRNMPNRLKSKIVHTHLAIDDAAEQGELLMNILAWEGKPKKVSPPIDNS